MRSALFCLIALSMVGCGSSIAPVSGKVTLDGAPLAGAQVTFTPTEAHATEGQRPSTATTDDSGNYSLSFSIDQEGAIVGKHKVEIFSVEGGEGVTEKEKLPAKYNTNSELTADVTAGNNTINFDLKSK